MHQRTLHRAIHGLAGTSLSPLDPYAPRVGRPGIRDVLVDGEGGSGARVPSPPSQDAPSAQVGSRLRPCQDTAHPPARLREGLPDSALRSPRFSSAGDGDRAKAAGPG